MIKLEYTDVHGFEAAVRGLRNPMNSWDKSDSAYDFNCDECMGFARCFKVGENDLALMRKLAHAGDDHGKFARFINVTVDIIAPTYFWLEFDTYKIGTVSNSCSKMHKLLEKPFSLDDFSFDGAGAVINKSAASEEIIDLLNDTRDAYLNFDEYKARDELQEGIDDKKQIWYAILSLLPMGYNQRRTVQLNYQVLHRIVKARKNHKLDEWRDLCDWALELPYFKAIYGDK